MVGTVTRFNVKNEYAFINLNDTGEDIFIHQIAITRNNQHKIMRSVDEGEAVEFGVVVGEKGREAATVTGPHGKAAKGRPHVAERRGFRSRWDPRRAQLSPVISNRCGPGNKYARCRDEVKTQWPQPAWRWA